MKRGSVPRHLNRSVRGELDWIAMKALEKDRTRRYETANDFAADVMRYLTDKPVEACPPSAVYRMRKFVKRNTGAVAAVATLVVVMILGTVGTSIGLVRSLRAEGLAQVIEERGRADTERAKAQASEADTKAFSDFLVNDVLAVARPKGEMGGLGIGVTIMDALESASEKIASRFRDRPLAEALARHDLGVTYRLIGELKKSEGQLRLAYDMRSRTLGTDHLSTLSSGNSLAMSYVDQGRFSEAEPLLVEVLAVRRRVQGEEYTDALISVNNLAIISVNNLAMLYESLGVRPSIALGS